MSSLVGVLTTQIGIIIIDYWGLTVDGRLRIMLFPNHLIIINESKKGTRAIDLK